MALTKMIFLVGLVVSIAWLVLNPGFPPVVAFISFLGLLVGQGISNRKKRRNEADLNLYREFIELLPSSGSTMEFLAEHDFGNHFGSNRFQPILGFIHEWQGPEKRFRDKRLASSHPETPSFEDQLAEW